MADPITAAGLASSIITFITFAYQVSDRARQFSSLAGELPHDLQACGDLVAVVLRCSERYKARILNSHNHGPHTACESDLIVIFEQSTKTVQELLAILDDLNSSGSFRNAIKSVRKQGKLRKLQSELERQILNIIYVCQEHSSGVSEDLQ